MTEAYPIDHFLYLWAGIDRHQFKLRMLFGKYTEDFIGKGLVHELDPIEIKQDHIAGITPSQHTTKQYVSITRLLIEPSSSKSADSVCIIRNSFIEQITPQGHN